MHRKASTLAIVGAFAAIYVLWGSTYVFIKFGVETIPPFFMAGARHLIAGTLLYAWVRLRGAEPPALLHWGSAAVLGALMLFGGNGGVTWAEQRVPSGLAALMVGTVPLWMALLDWVRPGGVRPGPRVAAGLILGFAGVALLVGPAKLAGGSRVDPIGAAVLVAASLSWAIGSLYSRRAPLPRSLVLGIAIQSLAGGTLLFLVGLFSGEAARLHPEAVSLKSLLSVVYLAVFGSIVGFTCYIWLLRVVTAARVSTYAYVNPVVALLLGWFVAGESISTRTVMAAAVIVLGVVLIVSQQTKTPAEQDAAKAPAEKVPAIANGHAQEHVEEALTR